MQATMTYPTPSLLTSQRLSLQANVKASPLPSKCELYATKGGVWGMHTQEDEEMPSKRSPIKYRPGSPRESSPTPSPPLPPSRP